jgi:NAD-dependent DNA ligase
MYKPIVIGGDTHQYTSGFNLKYIIDNKLGPGAEIQIIKSGDVIPYIKKVIVPATIAKMPSYDYKWNETHVDIVLKDIGQDETVREKNITGFFKGIGVDGLSSGNVMRLINAGFSSVEAIISMDISDFLKVDGFQTKMATKIYK